jgi:NAD(P)-dependent dehydrogenase (short-subunit alcohol dehydrogenase family)
MILFYLAQALIRRNGGRRMRGGHMKRVAIITGASQGLGLALARAVAAAGWSVVIDARRGDRLTAALDDIRQHAESGSEIVAIVGDVTDPAHRAELRAHANRLGTRAPAREQRQHTRRVTAPLPR